MPHPSILFFIKKSQPKKTGLYTLMIRITIQGDYLQFSSGLDIDAGLWDQKSNCFFGRSSYAKEHNNRLSSIRHTLYDHCRQLSKDYNVVSPLQLKHAYLGYSEKTFISILFKEYLEYFTHYTGNTASRETPIRYKLTHRRLKLYLQKEYGKDDIVASRLSIKDLHQFYSYLTTERNCNNNTAMKYMMRLSAVIRYGKNKGVITHDPFSLFKFKLDKTHPVYLTKEEVDRIGQKDFLTPRLHLIRDLFIFSCYTGLSYADINRLEEKDLSCGPDGKTWIIIERKKSAGMSYIPLLPVPLEIIDKYRHYKHASNQEACLSTLYTYINQQQRFRQTDKLLPCLTNQKTNEYLKEIAEVCGIEKHLTFHVARHSFATLALEYGLSIESLSMVLGHRHIRSTQIYARITQQKLVREMEKIEETLNKEEREQSAEKQAISFNKSTNSNKSTNKS